MFGVGGMGVRWSIVMIKQGVSCVPFFESGSCPVALTRTCACVVLVVLSMYVCMFVFVGGNVGC